MNKRRFRPLPWLPAILALIFLAGSVAPGVCSEQLTVELKVGGSEFLRIGHPANRISVVSPDVVEATLVGGNEIWLRGKKPGQTDVVLWEGDKRRTLLEATVVPDIAQLKRKIHELYPDEAVEVHATSSGVVLAGTVSGPEVVEQILRLARTFFPESQTPGSGGTSVTNLLRIGGIQQVLLEVKFAEVTRDSQREFQAALGLINQGRELQAAAGVGSLGVTSGGVLAGVDEGSLLLNFAGNGAANLFVNIRNLSTALRFLETEGLARILAEPRLVTQSGQEASFLAGGEFPIPVLQGTSAGTNTVTVEYRDFGVTLRFTPVVLSDGRISLRVSPSVSEITDSGLQIPTGVKTGGKDTVFSVPSLSTRRLDTTVQLYDGQTLALAGLLRDDLRETIQKVPALGDLPILGALFRSSGFTQNKTDLLVAVTPHLVKSNREGTLAYPGEMIQIPNRFEFYLEGRLEGRRSPEDQSAFGQHAFTPPKFAGERQGGLEGDFGHQPIPVR